MKEIPLENLSAFEGIFEAADKEKHVVILLTIKTFRRQFALYPELKECTKLFALCDDWAREGIFFMTFTRDDMEQNVYFDCIDDSTHHFDLIKSALMTLDYRISTCFFAIRSEFRELAFEVQHRKDLKMTDDTDTICLHAPMERALELDYEIPPGYEIRSLTLENVEQVNSVWPHRFEQSELFVAYSISYHVSTGLFDGNGNLVAWCLRYDNGALGLLQVDTKHLRKGFGELVARAILKTIAETCRCDVIAMVVHDNVKSINLFKKLNFTPLSAHTWFAMQQR